MDDLPEPEQEIEEELECAICLESGWSAQEYKYADKGNSRRSNMFDVMRVRTTPCGHPFCDSCLREYVSLSMRLHNEQPCPLCKVPLPKHTLEEFGIDPNLIAPSEDAVRKQRGR